MVLVLEMLYIQEMLHSYRENEGILIYMDTNKASAKP